MCSLLVVDELIPCVPPFGTGKGKEDVEIVVTGGEFPHINPPKNPQTESPATTVPPTTIPTTVCSI